MRHSGLPLGAICLQPNRCDWVDLVKMVFPDFEQSRSVKHCCPVFDPFWVMNTGNENDQVS